MTKTDKIIRALVWAGYTRADSRSARTCYQKQLPFRNRETGERYTRPHFVWIMTGTVRYAYENKFTEARSGDAFAEKLVHNWEKAQEMNMGYEAYCAHLKAIKAAVAEATKQGE